MSTSVGVLNFTGRNWSTAPTFTVTSNIGTRTLNWTEGRISITVNARSIGSSEHRYAWVRLYDATTGTILKVSSPKNKYVRGGNSETFEWSILAGSASISMPTVNTNHSIVLQVGESSTTSESGVTWATLDNGSSTVTIPGARSFGITYYDYDGGTYLSTTGTEASYHTINNPGSALRGFTSWNTSSDGTGTTYNPGSTRYVDGNLVFYAMGNPNIYKMNMYCYLGSNQVNAFGQMTYKLGSNYEQEEAFLTRQISQYSGNINQVGSHAFEYCPSLTSINLPQVTTIGSYAFASCYNLLTLSLPGNSVVSLASTTVFNSTPISTYTTSTGGVYGSIYVPASLYNSYITATNWSVYSARIVSI